MRACVRGVLALEPCRDRQSDELALEPCRYHRKLPHKKFKILMIRVNLIKHLNCKKTRKVF